MRRVLRCIEIVLHREALRRTKNTKCTIENIPSHCHSERSRGIPQQNLKATPRDPSTSLRCAQDDTHISLGGKKNREENKFSSRVEVRVMTPTKIGAVNTATGLMPLFLRCFFLCCFFLCHRLIPPFQSATRGAL